LTFYALAITGEQAAVSLWSRVGTQGEPLGVEYALDDGAGARLVRGGYLRERLPA